MTSKDVKFDCRYFSGDKPCRFKALCVNCCFYKPVHERILIIKLASAGDVLRTTVVLPALRQKYPYSHITWLVRSPAEQLLETNPDIDRILIFNPESVLSLQVERFNLVISLDKAVEAVSLASLITADKKYGFGLSGQGKIYPFNKEAEYSFILGLDNELKFCKNKKTYQEMVFEIAKLKYKHEPYQLKLFQEEVDFADRFLKNNRVEKKGVIIGINTGAGKVFANKYLKPERIAGLIKLLTRKTDVKILLLGGPLEKENNKYILKMTKGRRVIDGGCEHSLREFSALVDRCSGVITADTLALHIAIALNKPVVALFGPTCNQEIELYNRGKKIVTDADCAPCYKNKCYVSFTCMDKIKLEKIADAVDNLFKI